MVDLTKLYEYQVALDKTIAENHHVTYETTKTSRTLALLVEIGECLNETRCFKYWSNKGPSPKDVILEEYVDGLHFFLSLGIEIETELKSIEISDNEGELNEQFLTLYELVTQFALHRGELNYIKAFSYFLNLSKSLGFAFEEVENAYLKKLNTNYKRQENNY
jgi:dimeric dUTPase (all-alpha-NTP-PPase superfamily)